MRSFKMFGALVAVLAFSALGVASASAAEFTAEATGKIDGKALATQVFSIHAGEQKVTCGKIDVSGEVVSLKTTQQEATVTYTECVSHTPFGTVATDITPATYLFTANGEVHIQNTITIKVTVPFANCHITVPPTKTALKTVDYANSGNNIKLTPTVTGIVYTTTGGFCGASGSDGTYSGASEVTLESGKKLSFDA
jgi:hypothetical protein